MIFITGATGFIGSYIARYLIHHGYKVRAMKRSGSSLAMLGEAADKIEWIEGDLLDTGFLEESLSGIDEVYHCAAIVSFNPKDSGKMMKVNVEGTANVVNSAIYNGVTKFLHISSIAALSRHQNTEPIKETNQWQKSPNNSDYGISKFCSEKEVWRGVAEGLNAVIINPSLVMGAGEWKKGTARIFTRIAAGQPFYTQGATGFVDVRDVARCAITLMDKNCFGERYIINGENLTFHRAFTAIAHALSVKPPRWKAGKFTTGVAWRIEKIKSWISGEEPLITKSSARIANSSFKYDNSKIISQLDYKFVPIEKTIKDTAAVFLRDKATQYPVGLLPLF